MKKAYLTLDPPREPDGLVHDRAAVRVNQNLRAHGAPLRPSVQHMQVN